MLPAPLLSGRSGEQVMCAFTGGFPGRYSSPHPASPPCAVLVSSTEPSGFTFGFGDTLASWTRTLQVSSCSTSSTLPAAGHSMLVFVYTGAAPPVGVGVGVGGLTTWVKL